MFSSEVATNHTTQHNRQHSTAKEYVEAVEASQHEECGAVDT